MRGKLKLLLLLKLFRRITPACAGKTGYAGKLSEEREDHPRVCGENVGAMPKVPINSGSPPRVRGKLKFSFAVEVWQQDHPRVCGENIFASLKLVINLGSPPRVRGKLSITAPATVKPRITPACAGKTIKETFWINSIEDHPRVCGENCPQNKNQTAKEGSPPRVRGKHGNPDKAVFLARITPACAGKTIY